MTDFDAKIFGFAAQEYRCNNYNLAGFSVKCQKIMNNVNQCFPKAKEDVRKCPNIHFTVTEEKRKQKIFTVKTLFFSQNSSK